MCVCVCVWRLCSKLQPAANDRKFKTLRSNLCECVREEMWEKRDREREKERENLCRAANRETSGVWSLLDGSLSPHLTSLRSRSSC